MEQRLLHSLTKRGRKVAAATPEAVSGVDLVTLPDGQVLDATVPSPKLGRSLGYRIYLPPGYDDPRLATMRYPVMYLLHGAPGGERDWVDGASANQTADALIKSGTIPPIILVMPDGCLGDPHHDTQWGNSPVTGERVEDALVQDLIPAIDHTYRTIAARTERAIGGLSSGGYGAVNIALHHPDCFAAVVALSGYFRADKTDDGRDIWGSRAARRTNSPIGLLQHQPLHIDIIAGRDDAEYLNDSHAFTRALRGHDIDHQLQVFHGGHTWKFWRDHLAGGLRYVGRHLTLPASPSPATNH